MEHFSSERNPLRKDFRSTGTAIEPPGFSTPAGVLYYHKPIRHGWHSLSVSFPGVPHFLTVRTHLSEKSAWSLEIPSYRSPAISFTSGAVRCGVAMCARCRNAIWEQQWQTRLISHDWCRRLLKVVPAALIPLIRHLFADQQMSSHGGLFTSHSEPVEFDVIFAGYCKRCFLKKVHIGFGLRLVDYWSLEYRNAWLINTFLEL